MWGAFLVNCFIVIDRVFIWEIFICIWWYSLIWFNPKEPSKEIPFGRRSSHFNYQRLFQGFHSIVFIQYLTLFLFHQTFLFTSKLIWEIFLGEHVWSCEQISDRLFMVQSLKYKQQKSNFIYFGIHSIVCFRQERNWRTVHVADSFYLVFSSFLTNDSIRSRWISQWKYWRKSNDNGFF